MNNLRDVKTFKLNHNHHAYCIEVHEYGSIHDDYKNSFTLIKTDNNTVITIRKRLSETEIINYIKNNPIEK